MATTETQDHEAGEKAAPNGANTNSPRRHEVVEVNQEAHKLLDLGDAFTPDPGTEDMFRVVDSKFAFSPGQLSKLFNPKSLNAFYALGGLTGLEKGLRTNRSTGLVADETTLDGSVTYEEVAAKGAPKCGQAGDTVPESKGASTTPPVSHHGDSNSFADRKRIFSDNRLPEKKTKSLLELAWIAYNDKVLILLTIAAVVSLSLGYTKLLVGSMRKANPA